MAELQISGLLPNVTYKVSVRAKNSDGQSQLSPVLQFTTPSTIISGINSNNLIQLKGGAIFAGTVTGPGVLFNQDGLKGIKSGGASSFFIDANTGDAYFSGSVVANAGQIGGFRIGPTSLSAQNIVIDSGAGLNLGPNKYIVDNNGNASVAGNIIATSGSFNGGLYASVGNIGGWTIASTQLTSTSIWINSQFGYIEAGISPNSVVMNKTTGFYSGGGRDGSGNPTSTTPFWVTIDGNLRATNASITGNIVANSGSFLGAITASVGRIGGFTLQSNSLSAQNVVLSSLVGLNLGGGVFSVDQNGALRATSASISGDIVARSGSISGVLAISPSGSLIAGDLTTNYVSIGGVGVQGVQGGLTTFYLPTDGTSPIIGGFKVLQTGLVTVGEVTGKTISGTKGQTTITVSPDNTNLFIGMAVEDYPGYTLVPSGTVITGINGTTISLSTATLGVGTFSGYAIKFVPNGNLIVGTNTNNGIIIRGSTVGALTPAIFTRISGAATTDLSGNGFYIGQDGKFRLAGTNGYVSMDGSGNLFVSGTIDAASGNFRGTLTSSVGQIGGWSLAASSLYATNILLDTASGIVLGSGSQVKLTPGGTASLLNLYASGTIVATSGSFTGALTASVGRIGGWSLAASSLFATNILLDTSSGIVLGSSSQVKLTPGGAASLTNLFASGTIIATSGSFTGAINSASIFGGIIQTLGNYYGANGAEVSLNTDWSSILLKKNTSPFYYSGQISTSTYGNYGNGISINSLYNSAPYVTDGTANIPQIHLSGSGGNQGAFLIWLGTNQYFAMNRAGTGLTPSNWSTELSASGKISILNFNNDYQNVSCFIGGKTIAGIGGVTSAQFVVAGNNGTISLGSINNSFVHAYTDNNFYLKVVGTSVMFDTSLSGGVVGPYADNDTTSGNATHRWKAVYAVNGTIQTSDINFKKNIVESDLGLNFIKKLRPVSYNMKNTVPIFQIDENGNYVLDENGGRVISSYGDGTRKHYGLISQEVKQTLIDIKGDTDFGGWIQDDLNSSSSTQSLRYDEFISPIIKSIQELVNKIDNLETRIAALENK